MNHNEIILLFIIIYFIDVQRSFILVMKIKILNSVKYKKVMKQIYFGMQSVNQRMKENTIRY